MNFRLSGFIAGAMLLAAPILYGQDSVNSSSIPAGTTAVSVVPHYMKYSGTLPGAPGRANVVDVKFTLYANQTGGEPVWSETQQVTLDATGKYSVLLGSMTSGGMPGSIFVNGQARWVGVTLGSEQESARNILVATPYSFKASDADTIGGHLPSEFVLRDGNPRIPLGTPITQIDVLSPLTGGGKGSTVSIGLDTGDMPRLTSTNIFSSSNAFSAGLFASNPSPSVSAIYATTAASNLFSIEDYSAAQHSWGIGAYATNYPLFAQAMDTTAGDETIAVYGQTFNSGSASFGVVGEAKSGHGASGVYGLSGSPSTEGTEVEPVLGGAGVWADTNQFGGVGAGLLATADDNDAAIFASNSATGYYTVYVQNDDITEHAGPFEAYNSYNHSFCQMDAYADLTCSGILASVNAVSENHKVASYSVQSSENWIEDFGSGQLTSGHASITVDPAFAETVNTGVEYHVFLTANGDCKGLYISSKGSGSFEVAEFNGGTSSVSFDYRIVAKRKGYESVRLASMDKMAQQVKTPSGHPYPSKEARPAARRPAASPADRRGPGIGSPAPLLSNK